MVYKCLTIFTNRVNYFLKFIKRKRNKSALTDVMWGVCGHFPYSLL